MDLFAILFLSAIIFLTCLHFLKSIFLPAKLPPGPYPYPIIGNFLQLGRSPHQSLANLAKIYGPLMYLKLGAINTIVVSSPELYKQVLQKHDQVLSGRPNPVSTGSYNHNKASVAWLPVNARWRVFRRVCKDFMFSPQRLDASWGLRTEKLRKLLDYVRECCSENRVVDIADAAFTTSLNLISATMFSMDLAQFSSDSSHEFKETVHGLMRMAGIPNVADYFPILMPLDPQGFMPKATTYFGKLLETFNGIIDKRLQDVELESKNDVLLALLDLSRKNESEFSRNDILHLLAEHWDAAIHVLRYLARTRTAGLFFPASGSFQLTAYSDADWATCSVTRRSLTGFCILLGGSLVSWKSKKQPTVSKSSCEAEYRSLGATVAELQWLSYLLKDLDVPVSLPIEVWCDNKAVIHITENPVFHERTKHLEIDCHVVRNLYKKGFITLQHIHTSQQLADMFTKSLGGPLFRRILCKLGFLFNEAPT